MPNENTKSGLKVGIDDILQGIRNLDDQALTQVAGEVSQLLTKRKSLADQSYDSTLVKRIKSVIPASILRRQKQLYDLLSKGIISSKEEEELQLLHQFLEKKTAERIRLIGELAELRGITAKQLVADLKLIR